ncbi:MAG: IS66 family insertion sequence element accessory protein TnpB [Planctomycetes bacterium]|nr:IS66 family insertion sequence element accessory protein TnpB [Planctomycetota bacterium]
MTNLFDARIFLCTTPTKMTYSFDRLMALAQKIFDQDPLSGHLFLFFNRSRDRIKILFWDRDGFCIWYKRLERGTFQLPRIAGSEQGIELDEVQLYRLLDGLDLKEWQEDALRQRIGVIFQDFSRYQFLVGENIGVGDVHHFDDQQRWKTAADKGMADALIADLPLGYETQLGKWFKDGQELSGGQWQKIALSSRGMQMNGVNSGKSVRGNWPSESKMRNLYASG